MKNLKFAIIGAGNMGSAITEGFLKTGIIKAENIYITDCRTQALDYFKAKGLHVGPENNMATAFADIIILAIKPYQIKSVLEEIKPNLTSSHKMLISIAAGASIKDIEAVTGKIPIFRTMPNTAISIQESMTCIAEANSTKEQQNKVLEIFNLLGKTVMIPEDLINAATVLGSCGTAYALRFIRASIQGGIEIGFHSEMAQLIVSQTVLGAAKLILDNGHHPEQEIDRVTTPQGITITGLNEMEHQGFSSAIIKGLITAYNKIKKP
jgi:pyrroline-5-carboxylate reductase